MILASKKEELEDFFMVAKSDKDLEKDIADLRREHKRCVELYMSGVLHNPNHIYTQSVFIELIIRLNDILQALDERGKRIDFDDDVIKSGKVGDVTDLVNRLRNTVCHERTTGEKNIGTNTFVFNRIVGKVNVVKIGDITLGSDYNDDIAFFYGDKRIYLIRHVERLLNEVNSILYYTNR